METVFLILAIGFALVMMVIMFKYANFIHHFPHPEKSEEENSQNDSKKEKPPEV